MSRPRPTAPSPGEPAGRSAGSAVRRLAVSLVAICCLALWLGSAGADAAGCPLIKNSSIASASGLEHVFVIVPGGHGGGGGEEKIICRIGAYSGAKPTTTKMAEEKQRSGAFVIGVIDGWGEASNSPNAEEWRETGFNRTLAMIYGSSHAVTKAAGGSNFDPPGYGAEIARGWQYERGGASGAIGLWYSASTFGIVDITMSAGSRKSDIALVQNLGKFVVPLGI
jgi:hypothetical protein